MIVSSATGSPSSAASREAVALGPVGHGCDRVGDLHGVRVEPLELHLHLGRAHVRHVGHVDVRVCGPLCTKIVGTHTQKKKKK